MRVNSVISKMIMSVFFIQVIMLNISCTSEHSSKGEREAHQSEEGGGEGGEGEEGEGEHDRKGEKEGEHN